MVWVGVAAVVVAVVCALVARSARARVGAMVSTETLPVGELRALHEAAVGAAGPGNFRYTCEVVGEARPHKDGVLRSELAGLDCVWYRHRITREYEEFYRDDEGNDRRRTRTEVVSSHSSSTAFFVQDATGRMAIRPGDHEVTGAEKVLEDFEPYRGGASVELGPLRLNLRGGGTVGFKREEWVVRPGSRFYVHGEATDAGGRLTVGAPADKGVFVMSVKSEEELLRGERAKVLGFGIGAGVAAVAGIVLLVIGIAG